MATPPTVEKLQQQREQAIRRVQESSHDWGDLTPPVVEVHNHVEKRPSDPVKAGGGLLWKVALFAVAAGGFLGSLLGGWWKATH